MTTSRRKFLKAGMVAAVFAAVPLRNVLGQGNGNQNNSVSITQNDPLAFYTKATFTFYINSIFQLHTVSGAVAVMLLKVDDMPAAKGGECFSLLFRGGSRPLRQDTYRIEHPALGTFYLLLVPAGTDQNGAQGYLATINRLTYSDALMVAPAVSPFKKRSGTIGSGITTSTPNNALPAPTATPSPARPEGKPVRKKKPSSNRDDDEEDFEGV